MTALRISVAVGVCLLGVLTASAQENDPAPGTIAAQLSSAAAASSNASDSAENGESSAGEARPAGSASSTSPDVASAGLSSSSSASLSSVSSVSSASSVSSTAVSNVVTDTAAAATSTASSIGETADRVASELATNEGAVGNEESELPRGAAYTTGVIVKVIVGLTILFVLAFLAGHPRVEQIENALGITHVVTAGFPFVALGLIAAHPSVGVLSGAVVDHLSPLINFGLGWLGFTIGLQLDMRFLDKLPKGTAFLVVVEASMPFIVIAGVCGAIMIAFGQSIDDASFARDALILAAAGAMTAPIILGSESQSAQAIAQGWQPGHGLDSLISQLDEIAGIVGLLFLAAYFRPGHAPIAWTLPGTAWVFVTVGLGVAIGVVMYIMLRSPSSNAERLAILLGFVAFAAGMAGYLYLSSIVVCFVAGVLLTNFPGDVRRDLMPILSRLERPIYMMFLIMVGAYWSVGDYRGWLLLPCFIAARFVGTWVGVEIGKRTEIEPAREEEIEDADLRAQTAGGSSTSLTAMAEEHGHRALVAPLSALSLAIVVNVHVLYVQPGVESAANLEAARTIGWLMTSVIGGAILTEILVQLLSRRREGSVRRRTSTSGAASWREVTPLPDLDAPEAAGASSGEDSAAGTTSESSIGESSTGAEEESP